MRRRAVMSICICLYVMCGAPSLSWAYCSEPSAPRYSGPEKPDEPSAPYCVNEYSRTHTCDDYEIDGYNNDIRQYNDDVEDYKRAVEDFVADLRRYVEEASDYAQCAVRQLE